jgi:DNA-binding NarL/FixJ family response regulator
MRVLVLDDHRLFLDGLCSLLKQWREGICLVTCSHVSEAVHLLQVPPRYDLVLSDLTLPDSLEPAGTLQRVVDAAAGVPVAVVSMLEAADVVSVVQLHGARAFIRKSDGAAVMLASLDLVLAGGTSYPAPPVRPPASLALQTLSLRQREVLHHLEQGLSNKEIARRLCIAETTVKVHVHRILQLLGSASRAKAAAWAREARVSGAWAPHEASRRPGS